MTPAESDRGEGAVREALRRLYAAPLAEFVPLRKTIATELKNSGDSRSAAIVTEARKPTATAWAVNQLAHRHAKVLARFIEDIESLRSAQRDLLEAPAAKVAEAKNRFRAARDALSVRVSELAGLAREVLASDGVAWNLTTQKRIMATLNVLPLASATDRTKLLEGRLEKDLDASSDDDAIASAFGPVDEGALGARKRERAEAPPAKHVTHTVSPLTQRSDAAEKREAAKEAERERRERAQREVEARERLRTLTHKVDEAEREAKRLDAEATKAEAAAVRARGDADRAKARAKDARERLATLRST